jgi:PAS domain S-box-containing protein
MRSGEIEQHGAMVDMASPASARRSVARYATGALAAVLAISARLALDPILGIDLPYITFFAAVIAASWVGGVGPGLLAVSLCTASAVWFWLPSVFSPAGIDAAELTGLLMFIGLSSLIAALGGAQRETRRRLAAASVRARTSDEHARGILESISDAFYALDGDFRFTFLNRRAVEHFRRPAAELIGRTLWEAQPEKRGTIFEESFRLALAERRPVRFEALSPADHRWVDVHAYPAVGGRGLSVFLRDISERRAWQLGEERMKAILRSASDAIITIDERETITMFSAGAEQIFRCAADAALGEKIERFIPQRFRASHHQFIRAFGDTGVSTRPMGGERVLAALRADGEEFPMEARISQSVVAGEKLYTVILRDVTDRKRSEEEREELLDRARRSAAEADRANRAKDEFLAVVSHELRTPLTPILSWARMLRMKPPTTQTLERGLETIERAARSQAQLIEDLLDISRIIAGKVRLDVQRIEIGPVIDAAIDSIRPAADAKNIRLVTVLDPRAGLVSADRERLQQVIWNLLSNAIKFTPKEGRVQVVVQRVNSHVEIVVHDTGRGIDPDFLPYVFDRFRQDDASTTRAHGGLGLGLAIVRHLVELHGGTVRCHSPGAGRGATFTVALPLAPVQTQMLPSETHPVVGDGTALQLNGLAATLRGVRVLVVDDEQDTLDTIAMVLGEAGAEVKTALSARSGFAVLNEWTPDVLVSDLGMPEEDGIALIRKIRELPPERGGRVPALALTAFARVEDRLKVLNAGFQMHVAKPIEPSELVTVVSSVSGLSIKA